MQNAGMQQLLYLCHVNYILIPNSAGSSSADSGTLLTIIFGIVPVAMTATICGRTPSIAGVLSRDIGEGGIGQ
jgi:hypothetical protein